MLDIILIYLLMFSDYQLGMLCISDLAFIVLVLKACFMYNRVFIKKDCLAGLLLMMIGILLSTLFNFYKDYFSFSHLIVSVGKLTVYLLGISIVPKYIISKGVNIEKILHNFLIVSVFGALFQYLVVIVLGRGVWPLYSLGGNFFGLVSDETMFSYTGMMRARSFWSEPAHYAITISMLFILILYFEKENTPRRFHFIYVLGIITANSISGYGIMLAIYAIYLINFKSSSQMAKTLILGAVLSIGMLALIETNSYLKRRVINLFLLKDGSGVVRTIGGFHFLTEVPWYGTGVGNSVTFYKHLGQLNPLWYSGSGEFYNNILLAIITMGYIGAIGFLLYQYGILKKHKKIFLALMVIHCGWGKLFAAPIWVFLVFYLVLDYQFSMSNETNKKKKNRAGHIRVYL